jgi:starch phosphorylase
MSAVDHNLVLTKTPLRLLIVDDSPGDAELMVAELIRNHFELAWTRVDNESDYMQQIEQHPPELILADYSLPQFSAARALELLQDCGLSIPFVLVSGTIGEQAAVTMIKQGAFDYVLKDHLDRLAVVTARALQGIRKIAYFSMEIALESAIPTYSGGLGVLAGDTIRSAADLQVPIVAVSLLHRTGYFKQQLDNTGWQTEEPVEWEVERFLQEMLPRVSVNIEGRIVNLRAWKYDIRGAGGYVVPVYLLDSDVPENGEWDRGLTRALYGGDSYYRLCQEIVLGIGGLRMLHALGHDAIERFHMNEGHASLLTLALLQEEAQKAGRPRIELSDLAAVRQRCIFTTHTPVPAGHDQFSLRLLSRTLGLREDLSDIFCPDVAFRVFGQRHTSGKPASFPDANFLLNMTHLALNTSRYINGVAKRHGEISRLMFAGYQIDAITNGVHVATWASKPFQELYDRHIPDWRQDNFSLRYAESIPKDEVWKAHSQAKGQLLDWVQTQTGMSLDRHVFTIGFARRFTAYKRPDLIFSDVERLKRICRDAGRLQIVCAGKAHPCDYDGKLLIQRVCRIQEALKGNLNIAYLVNYDLEIARLLTSGVDVWLNTPQPPLEASGTSGMKAAVNGVPSLSVLDGWWIEGLIEGITGWSIGEPHRGKAGLGDSFGDASSLYQKLEGEIIPIFYKHQDRFVEIMRHAIALNGSFFNTQRMLHQYVLRAYFR